MAGAIRLSRGEKFPKKSKNYIRSLTNIWPRCGSCLGAQAETMSGGPGDPGLRITAGVWNAAATNNVSPFDASGSNRKTRLGVFCREIAKPPHPRVHRRKGRAGRRRGVVSGRWQLERGLGWR
jgi:hypothetical protein